MQAERKTHPAPGPNLPPKGEFTMAQATESNTASAREAHVDSKIVISGLSAVEESVLSIPNRAQAISSLSSTTLAIFGDW